MANTNISLEKLNGITSRGGGDASGLLVSVWRRLQGVRLDPKLANGAIFRVATGHQSDAESLGLNRLVDFSDRHAITVLENLSDLLVAFVVPYRYSTTGT